MSLEKTAMEQREVPQKEQTFTAAGQIHVSTARVRLYADAVSGPYTVVLPPVAEAQGRDYFIVARQATAINFITVTHDNDSECWEGNVVFNGKCDKAIFRSDGQCWFQCCADIDQVGTTLPPTTVHPSTSPPTTPATTLTTGIQA